MSQRAYFHTSQQMLKPCKQTVNVGMAPVGAAIAPCLLINNVANVILHERLDRLRCCSPACKRERRNGAHPWKDTILESLHYYDKPFTMQDIDDLQLYVQSRSPVSKGHLSIEGAAQHSAMQCDDKTSITDHWTTA